MSPADTPSGRRILAVRGGALGDFILTLPAIRQLRCSASHLELLTRPAYGRFAQDFGLVSGWRALDAPDATWLTVAGGVLSASWLQWLGGFDAVVSWVPDPDGVFQEQIRRCGVAEFHQADGRCAGQDPAAQQLSAGLPPWAREVHPAPPFCLFADPTTAPQPPESELIAFHPGSGSARKNWPLEHWLIVLTGLQRLRPASRWLVITGEVEAGILPSLHRALEHSGLPWESLHDPDLTSLAHRLRPCRAFFGHDSGISHLAAACGVPCLVLFGPTDPAIWAPTGIPWPPFRAPQGNWQQLTPAAVLEWATASHRTGSTSPDACSQPSSGNSQLPFRV